MELIRGLHNLRPAHRDCVATIGNFDGMHLGHRALLRQLQEAATRHASTATVIIFEPQPREYFQGVRAPARLTRLREKLELLADAGVPRVLCLRFDADLAAMEAEVFVERILFRGLAARAVIIGDDFRFGYRRGGDLDSLARSGAKYGFRVERALTIRVDGERVSSSRVREALVAGDMEAARRLLGRYFSMSGRVAHGDKRGREIGFPTLNINLLRLRAPLEGIFAARVHGLTGGAIDGMAYVGKRPVVQGNTRVLEVHLFDFAADCYGRHVQVEFISRLREDIAFTSLDALREQMNVDADRARAALAGV